ncbi:FAD-dependent oxidoreductase [Paludibaculum fermentans]|uniref:FAD-dependent oxidoreductase n=1 Tax=Paludibaculum fermentans TaxID=1473598 RepID=A0A7S7SP00_PALFE|nr:FAD-dependent oxidoreductase [Paludibaculum fermentans]QOY91041.1 FAD-dependent oxidoreductase [Paludibaculum fermentans]
MRMFLVLLLAAASAAAQQQYDLVVYGGTAAGFATAVSGARQGLKTALLEPRNHIGGMISGGLSGTDVGRREVIGGLSLEFYYRAGQRYQMDRHLQELSWMPEPGVAESLMREMLKEAGVTLLEHHRLREKDGVKREGSRVTEIVTENGARFRAKVFADATYEGDLMAQSKVTYTYGREGISQYGESLAGVRAVTESHQFAVDIPARDEQGKLLPEVSAEPRGEPGTADKRIQAYNFRVIATNVPENRLPWPKPDGYDPKRYELLARYLTAMTKYMGRPVNFNEVGLFRIIPNGKLDLNNRGGFSTDYIGKNYGYPEGTYAERAKIWKEHEDYQKGFYYFLANDPRVPKELQDEVRSYGLPKDEFQDTGHWPNQLYVREARRMVGEFVSTQKDLQTERTKPDAIGMGSYNSDSHNLQRFVNAKGFVENEGDVQVPVQPYQIPYRVLVPKKSEVTNLLVPVCFSASHIAYSSMRMEPQYMILGHAAGIAAALAIRGGSTLQDINVPELQKKLKDEGAVFEAGIEFQNQGLATIRKRYAPAPRKGPVPWDRRAAK